MKSSKIARREAAARRFHIIPRSSMNPMPSVEEYDGYLHRKVTEAKALGLVKTAETIARIIHLVS